MKSWADLKKMISYSPGGIVSKEIFKSERLELGLYCMAKGSQMAEHTSTREVIVHVIGGKGVFRLGKEMIAMAPGVVIRMKPNAKHSLKADEDVSFILLMVQ
jgi:nitric oxide dioxygenase